MKTPRNSQARFMCKNPRCGHRNRSFSSERAFSLHVATVPSCAAFLCRSIQKPNGHSIELSCLPPTMYCSTVAQTLLRRDNVYHPNPSISLIDPPEPNTPESENIDFPVVDDYSASPSINTVNRSVDSDFEKPFVYTCDQKWTVMLLKILDELNAPDKAFSSIIRWAQQANSDGYKFIPPGGYSRTQNIDLLQQSILNANQLLPRVETVEVPHGLPTKVVTFDFVPQILHLLQNPALMQPENLAIDFYNPLNKYQPPNGVLGEALSGKVYSDAYERFVRDPKTDLFVPIIQWIDRTHVTGNDRYSLKPYMFTPAIFKEECRRKIQFWGYHGFLPKTKASSAQQKLKRKGDNMRNYHAELSIVLRSLNSATARLRNVWLPIGSESRIQVNVIPCVLFVIQDMQEGDTLCGRYGPHTTEISRHCRSCDVSFDDLGNPDTMCTWLYAKPMHDIATGVSKMHDDLRRRWSQHQVVNVYNSIPLADRSRGIFGATPVETMHAFRKGLIEKVTLMVVDHLTAGQKALLDGMAVQFHRRHSQSDRKSFPATDFSNGVTNLSKISASERVGLLFLFVILANLDGGAAVFKAAFAVHGGTNVRDIIELFESMLTFDAWLNQDTYWKISNSTTAIDNVQCSIRALLQMCCDRLPNGKWKFPKFHELLHITSDMQRFGAPKNFCAQRPESLLIYAAKRPGRRAQKRQEGAQYELQAAQRLVQSFIINLYHEKVAIPVQEENNPSIPTLKLESEGMMKNDTGHGTFGTVSFDTLQKSYIITWNTKTNSSLMPLSLKLMEFICNRFGNCVTICTEFQRDRFIFRCHPYFQSHTPRFDWIRIQFDDGIYPSRLAVVVVDQTETGANYYLIVQCTTNQTTHNERNGSVLFTEWNWSPDFYCVTPDNIDSPCFVISGKDDDSRVLETLPYEDWPSQFTQNDNWF